MAELTPVTRKEIYLAAAGGQEITTPEPVTRIELYLAKLAGMDVEVPEPVTRLEYFLAAACGMEVEKPIPVTRLEMLLDNISGGENDIPPVTRLEMFLAEIKGGEQPVLLTYTGNLPATITAVAHALASLTRYGLCTQDGTPTPDASVDIMTNNGAINLRRPSGMPIAYQMVEWLKPTGSIAITGFKTKSTQEIETVFYRESRGSTYLYSSDTATSGTTNTTAYLTTAGGNWRWDGKVATINPTAGIKLTSIQNKDGVWLNDTQYGYYTEPGDFVSTNDLRLSAGENTTVRTYSMTIREGETVTLDLVPVQRVTDSAYGFYDKVSGNFYTNADATFEAGDPIDDPVEIYTDGTPEVLTIHGANYIDPDKCALVDVTSSVTGRAGWILALPAGSYTISMWTPEASNTPVYARKREGSAAWENYSTITANNPVTLTLSADGEIAVYSAANTSVDTMAARSVMLEGGSTASEDYQPYVEQTVTVPMLLSVGDYKDEAELIQGIKTGRVGVKVFDGTEDWTAFTSSTLVIQNATSAWGAVAGVGGYCTHLTVLKAGETTFAGACRFATAFNVYEYKTAFGVADVAGFKAKLAEQYAAGTPVIVVYPLATETTEQTTPQHLVTHKGVNVVDSTANVEPVEAKIEYYGTETPMLGMGLMGMRPNSDSPEEPIEDDPEEPIAEEPAEEIPEEIAEEPETEEPAESEER